MISDNFRLGKESKRYNTTVGKDEKMNSYGKGYGAIALVMTLLSHAVIGQEQQNIPPTPEAVKNYMESRIVNRGISAPQDFQEKVEASAGGGSDDDENYLAPYAEKSMLPKLKVDEAITPDTTDLLGERIDLNTGSISFHQTDVSLPGNSGLEVAIRRVYRGNYWTAQNTVEFGDWKLDIPNINTTVMARGPNIKGSWGQGFECSGSLNPGTFFAGNGVLESHQYWNGDSLNVPGITNEKLLYPSGNLIQGEEASNYTRVTKSNWRISCFDRFDEDNQRVGEGFLAQSPLGTTYTFDQLRLVEAKPTGNKVWGAVIKYHVFMQVSLIEDKFGNWVRYHYEDDGRLTNITANDGRTITLTYDDPDDPYLVSKVQANDRTWEYQYIGQNYDRSLVHVMLPNQQTWTYDLASISNFEPNVGGASLLFCNRIADTTERKGSITHPNGMTGEFVVSEKIHGQTHVLHYPGQSGNIPECFSTVSLVRKTMSGYGIDTPLTWRYGYSQNKGTLSSETTVPDDARLTSISLPNGIDDVNHKTTTVSAPDGSKTRYFYNRDWTSALDGTQVASQYFDVDGSTLLKTVVSQFQNGPSIGATYMASQKVNDAPHRYRLELVEREIVMEHNDGTTRYATEFGDHNLYGEAQWVHQSGPAASRYIKLGYVTDRANWVLNLPTTVEVSSNDNSYTKVKETTYKTIASSNAGTNYTVEVPYEEKMYGTWHTRYTDYHADGNVTKVEFNQLLKNSNGSEVAGTYRYQLLESYKRGQPQKITLPSRYSGASASAIIATRTVDNNGQVIAVTDFNGNKFGYGYDKIGRLAYIDMPDDDNTWLDTLFTWTNVAGAAPTRTATRCQLNAAHTDCQESIRSTSEMQFDSLLRNILTINTDSITGISRYQYRNYNAYNYETFSSYWSDSSSESRGITTGYDGLQRTVSVSRSGLGSEITDYLSDNRIKKTDANGNVTTTTYIAYGTPSYQQATYIDSPEDVVTDIAVNLFGDVTSVTQDGPLVSPQTEYRAYDKNHHLCKVARNDVGVTVFTHSVIGEMLTRAEGVTTTSNTDCLSEAASDTVITLSSDNLGDAWKVSYPDGVTNPAPDIVYQRDNNGNIVNLTAGIVNQEYSYNSLDLPVTESLSFSGRKLIIGYGYDRQGSTSSFTYPDGYRVNYEPNGFGEPTGAERTKTGEPNYTFASDATYYPNGVLDSFDYGNGMVHKTSLHPIHQLPIEIRDAKNTTTALNYSVEYDNNLNITVQTDNLNNAYTLSKLEYDGLDRLTRTTGNEGIGSTTISYDGLGNLLSYSNSATGRTLGYRYNATDNRLTSVTGFAGKYSSFSYDGRGNIYSNGSNTFIYNRANQLIESDNTKYLYDGYNRRVKQTGTKGTSYSFYRQDGTLIYRETDNGGINYIYLGKKLIAKDGFIPEDSGTQHYLPFGESVEGSADDVGYAGHKFDADLGLSYMQARYYDPVIGRFYSNDPIGFTGEVDTFNRYSYVGNNPYKYTDPSGEAKVQISAELQIVAKLGFVVGGSMSFDTTNLEISGSLKAGGRAGLSGGAKGSLTVTESKAALGNSLNVTGSVNADAGIGIASQKVDLLSTKVDLTTGEISNTSGNGTQGTVGLNFKNGVNADVKVGASAGADATLTGTISIPETLKMIDNAVKEIQNAICDQC